MMFHLPNQSWNNEYKNPNATTLRPNQQSQCLVCDPAQDRTPVAHSQLIAAPQNVDPTPADTAPERPAPPVPEAPRQMKLFANNGVDTSTFSIEERLVAAVWVHERKLTRSSMSQIKREFRQRFDREPPAKNTLLVWERKLFSTGSVCDAPRSGRPVNRSSKVESVLASVRGAPALSQRARAAALRLPRTTLRTILRDDLRHDLRHAAPARAARPGKQQAARRVKPATARAPPQPALRLRTHSSKGTRELNNHVY